MAWAGVGCCLLSAILLSGAAVCLKNEREKEEHLNLQYLMPGKSHNGIDESMRLQLIQYLICSFSCLILIVYSQKQPPYPPYANYPQPQIYPGPYYHGSQYGPYNY